MSETTKSEIGRFLGLVLMAAGILWLVLTGLCSAAFAIGLLGEGNLSNVGAVLTIGVPSALIGGIVYSIGRWLRPKV